MIVGIDGNEANSQNRVGVNQYGFELLWALSKLQDKLSENHTIIVYLKEKPRRDLPKPTKCFKYRVLPGKGVWIISRLMPDLFFASSRPDIFFSLNHYVPPLAPMPRVCSIMDLGYLEFSGQFKKYDFWQLKYWSAYSIYVSKAVIAISNSTKEDIVRHYPFASKKTFVTLLGYDKKHFNRLISPNDVRRVKNKYSIVKDYVLYLSTLKPSKNVEGLLSAWRKVRSDFPGYCLVISGKKGWLYDTIFAKVKESGLTKEVIFTDFVPEEDKPALIRGAKAFVLPSYWEGFGLDPLNAMASGVPVVASSVGSLPEVVGSAGILVDPYNINSIAEGIKKVLSMTQAQYNTLVESGIKQARKFSWQAAARETLQILEKAAI